jgi:vesicle-associated membrane protein 7
MPILYSVVARGITVLAKYASCPGNFSEVTEQIIAKIPPDDSKLTYSHGSFLFHYICEDRIIYMCITDDVRKYSIFQVNLLINSCFAQISAGI